MLPKLSGTIKSHKNFQSLIALLSDKFRQGNLLKLKNNVDSNGKFTLTKQNQVFNPFDRKIILSEIRGKILDNSIHYEISTSNGWIGIIGIYLIILTFLALKFLIGGNYVFGISIMGFLGICGLGIYYWVREENQYLETQFLHTMKNA